MTTVWMEPLSRRYLRLLAQARAKTPDIQTVDMINGVRERVRIRATFVST